MVLNKSAWYSKLFRIGMKICARFTGKSYLSRLYEYHTNFCHLVRVITVYIPLILLTEFLVLAYVIYVWIYYPIANFGVYSYGKVVGVIIASLLLLIALII